MNRSPRVRIAPSPSGDPHVGTAFIALFNMIFARHYDGQFVLRIEDTDQSRSTKEYEKHIYEALSWCGISWDEGPDVGGNYGPYRQSERLEIYQKYAQILLDKGHAYKCFATAEELAEMREIARKRGVRVGYDRRYRNLEAQEISRLEKEGMHYVIRLRVPLTGECVFEDAIKGKITTPWADIDDQILIKSDGFPTYHLANVVDDHLMQITHVIRGDEWISSTAKHLLLYDYFGFSPPTFLHMPLLLGADGKKLSKRKNPTSIFYFKESGYLPEALLNFLSHMGYSMQDGEEIYSLEKIVREFDPKRIGASGAFFDQKKLDWINQKYLIETIEEEDLWDRIEDWSFQKPFLRKLMHLVHTRMKTFSDFIPLCDFFFMDQLPWSSELFALKGCNEQTAAEALQYMQYALQDEYTQERVEKASHEVATRMGLHHKKVIMPLLFATIMGKKRGPPLFASVEILGKERARARFLRAIEFLGGIGKKRLVSMEKAWQEGGSLAKNEK
ncbi:MAG: glutamate--tRNA ligase [Chlamydiota bacterium]